MRPYFDFLPVNTYGVTGELHEIFVATSGLNIARIFRLRFVLDIGTGTGDWAIDFGKSYG